MEKWIVRLETLLHRHKSGDYKVLKDGEALIKAVPKSLKAFFYVSLVNFALLANEIEKAQEYIEKAYQHHKDDEVLDIVTLIGTGTLVHFYKGELNEVLEIIEESGINDNYFIQFRKAECLYWLGKFEEAKEEYQKASHLCENDETLQEEIELCLFSEGRCWFQLGNMPKAMEYLELLYESKEKVNDAVILALGQLATIYAIEKNEQAAHIILEKDLVPSQFSHPYHKASALLSNGYVYFITENWEKAKEHLLNMVNSNIRQFEKLEAFTLLGDIEFKLKNYDQAIIWYDKVLQFKELFLAKEVESKLKEAALQLETRKALEAREEEKEEIQLPEEEVTVPQKENQTVKEEEEVTAAQEESKIAKEEVNSQSYEEQVIDNLPITSILFGLDMLKEQNYK